MVAIRFGILITVVAGAVAAQQPAAPPAQRPAPAREPFVMTVPGNGTYFFDYSHAQQPDPADSLYRRARDFLNRGDWGRAAREFREIATRYPQSTYAPELPYFEAIARYRIGTSEELRNAARLLEPRAGRLIGVATAASTSTTPTPGQRRTQDADFVGLYVQINKALAARGDNNAASIVARAAQAGVTCDREEMSIKAEAISALTQMDPNSALPVLQGVLAKKDECSVELRKSAVFVLGRRADSVAANLLASTAKTDPSTDVRIAAIGWLPRVQGDAGVNSLEEILRTETDERIQRSVVRTLTASDNMRARASMRALIDRRDATTSLRLEAVNAFNSDRTSLEDAAYLRSVYGRVDNERVKDALINTIGRIGGVDNDQWLLALARNTNEPSQFRGAAIRRLVRSNTPISDLMKLYEISDSYETRSRIVDALESRREQEAADRLVDIVKSTTEINIKTKALGALTRRKDPRAAQLAQEIILGRP